MGVMSGMRVLEFEAIGPAPFGTMRRGEHSEAALIDWGFNCDAIHRLRDSGLGTGDAMRTVRLDFSRRYRLSVGKLIFCGT